MKKFMEFRVEGRRPVGRPRRTWSTSIEADMAELEIDKEDVHDRNKWRRNVMKRTIPKYIANCFTKQFTNTFHTRQRIH